METLAGTHPLHTRLALLSAQYYCLRTTLHCYCKEKKRFIFRALYNDIHIDTRLRRVLFRGRRSQRRLQ